MSLFRSPRFPLLQAPPPPFPSTPRRSPRRRLAAAANFDSPADVQNVLRLIFLALAAGQISERRAGILTYISQTILHANRAVAQQQKLQAELTAQQAHDDEVDPVEPRAPAQFRARQPAIASTQAILICLSPGICPAPLRT